MASAMGTLGSVARSQGDHERAKMYFEQALTLRREQADHHGVGFCLHNLGIVAFEQGDLERARWLFEESLSLRCELGDRDGIGFTLNGLGNVARLAGDCARAKTYFEESLVCAQETANKRLGAIVRNNLGLVLVERGDVTGARLILEESLRLEREVGHQEFIAWTLEGFAALAGVERKPLRAAWLWGAAEALREAMGTPCHPPTALIMNAPGSRKPAHNSTRNGLPRRGPRDAR